MKRPRLPSAVEVLFLWTPDGLVIGECILKPARTSDEGDLKRFVDRITYGIAGVTVSLQVPGQPAP